MPDNDFLDLLKELFIEYLQGQTGIQKLSIRPSISRALSGKVKMSRGVLDQFIKALKESNLGQQAPQALDKKIATLQKYYISYVVNFKNEKASALSDDASAHIIASASRSPIPSETLVMVAPHQEAKAHAPAWSRFPIRVRIAVGIALVIIVVMAMGASALTSRGEKITRNEDWAPQTAVFNAIEMVRVPPGCFNMGNLRGNANEQPVFEYCFNEAFWISRTEITTGQFGSPPDEDCNTNKVDGVSSVNGIDAEFPRNCVTWEAAADFCLSRRMRLPSEAEWEYAARGPSSYLYPWGHDPAADRAVVRTNFVEVSQAGTMLPAGSKPQDVSWVGAVDMAGSLHEFTSTIYDTVTDNGEVQFPYPYDPLDGREAQENGGDSSDRENRGNTTTLRVVRGGSFDYGIDRATATFRSPEYFDFLWNTYGFRCALNDSEVDQIEITASSV